MYSTLKFLLFTSMVASSLAIKCFVCSSKELDSKAEAAYKNQIGYSVRQCQSSEGDTCEDSKSVTKQFTLEEYFLGESCGSFDSEKINVTDGKNIVDCKMGCVKIDSIVDHEGEDIDRVTRQCAYYDQSIVGKYLDETDGYKRTAAGSDRVLNWFYYCTSDYCNAASGIELSWALVVAMFYGVIAIYH